MTKEMNAANRIDTLSDALHHYAKQKIAKMGELWIVSLVSLVSTVSKCRNKHCGAYEESI